MHNQITKSFTGITKNNIEVQQQGLQLMIAKGTGFRTPLLQPKPGENTDLFSCCTAPRALLTSLHS